MEGSGGRATAGATGSPAGGAPGRGGEAGAGGVGVGGDMGAAATAGQVDTAGAAGSAGQQGAPSTAGMPGRAGSAGAAGSAGQGGSLGTAGSTGEAGSGGAAGGAGWTILPGGDGGSSGASGMSGTAGTAGGAAVSVDCNAPTIVGGTNPMIVDFEGANVENNGVNFTVVGSPDIGGGTFWFSDGTGPDDYQALALVAGGAPGSSDALSVTLLGSTAWGGGFGFWFDGCLDASAHDGVSFWVRSNVPSGTSVMNLQTAYTRVTDISGGLCDAATAMMASASLSVSPTWTEYRVAWSDFTGGLCGNTSITATGAGLLSLGWSIEGTDGTAEDLEFVIDDVAFYSE